MGVVWMYTLREGSVLAFRSRLRWNTSADITRKADERGGHPQTRPGMEWLNEASARDDAVAHALQDTARTWQYEQSGLAPAPLPCSPCGDRRYHVGDGTSRGPRRYGRRRERPLPVQGRLQPVLPEPPLLRPRRRSWGASSTVAAMQTALRSGLASLAGASSVSMVNNRGDIGKVLKDRIKDPW